MAATTGSANTHPQHKKCTSPSVTAFSLQTLVPQTSNASHRLVAVTEGSSASLLKVVRVDCISRVCKEVSSHSFKQLQFPTDVSWSLLDPEKLVVSFKSGSISCFNVLAVKARSQTYGLTEEWSSGNVSTGINRIVWHPSDRNTLAAANQDGTIKIFDCRCFKRDGRPNASTTSSPSSTVTCGRRLTQAARDVAFSPFQSHYIAEVSDSGCVQIWDWRMNEKPVRSRRKAHNSSVLSVAWSPLRDAVVATGSSDRTVKVWSTEDGSLEEWDASSSGVTVEPYTIFAGHEVWRLHWCCPDSYRTPPLLATVNNSPQLDNLGRVFVWDLVNPHLPVCTLDGHEHDLCVDFAWLSSSSSSSKRASTAPPGPPPDRVVRSSSSSRTSAGGGKSTAAAPTGWGGSGASVRGVLSVGRDGRLLVQELSSGWRPSSHMSSSIMAVSSKGHVAYHRGAQDLQVNLLLDTFPSSSPREPDDEEASTAAVSDAFMVRRSGDVFIGLENIETLEDAQRIRSRSERGAEARITDPALIHILAKKYRVAYTLDASSSEVEGVQGEVEEGEDEEVHDHHKQQQQLEHYKAILACRANAAVARAAGLSCRVAVWTTLLSLMPKRRRHTTEGHSGGLLHSSQKTGDTALKVKVRDRHMELPFTSQLLGRLLHELLEGGDVQHFVVACELLRSAGVLSSVCDAAQLAREQVRRGYLVYLDLLKKLELFCEANDLIKASDDEDISALSKRGVQIGMRCARCAKELKEQRDKHGPTSRLSTAYCEKCSRCAVVCGLCHLPVGGLVHWCPVCGHGGHLQCMQRWFSQATTCCSGCGHNCCCLLR